MTSVEEAIKNVQAKAVVPKEYIACAQSKMKLTTDRKCKDQEYVVNDMVMLKLQPYAQSSLVNRPFPKLAFKYFGPYLVLTGGQTSSREGEVVMTKAQA